MWHSLKLWFQQCLTVKVIGLLFLIIYFSYYPVQFEPAWSLLYAVIVFASIPIYTQITKYLTRSGSNTGDQSQTQDKIFSETISKENQIGVEQEQSQLVQMGNDIMKKHPYCFWLASAESAFFYVPLLWVGINPISAFIAASLFGFAHYPAFFLRNCIYKTLIQFFVALVILPHGILTVMLGHFIVDNVPFIILKLSKL